MKKYYLAYGSNLNVDQMRWRCPNARALGTAEMSNYQLLFKGSKTGSYLTIEPREGSVVPVAVWEVTDSDEERLDRYEGYPSFYYKKNMRITYTGIRSKKKRTVDAFVYIMHEDRALGIPTRSYVDTCRIGYYDFGFDENILRKAIYDSMEGMQ